MWDAALAEGDKEAFLLALRNVLEAQGGLSKFLVANVSSSATLELGPLPAPLKKALKAKQPVTFIYVTPQIEKDFSQ